LKNHYTTLPNLTLFEIRLLKSPTIRDIGIEIKIGEIFPATCRSFWYIIFVVEQTFFDVKNSAYWPTDLLKIYLKA